MSRREDHLQKYWHVIPLQQAKGWMMNIVGFAGHTVSVASIQLCHCIVEAARLLRMCMAKLQYNLNFMSVSRVMKYCPFFFQLFRNVKNTLSSWHTKMGGGSDSMSRSSFANSWPIGFIALLITTLFCIYLGNFL